MADNILYGDEVWSNEPARTQVFQATHDEEGNRLPHLLRSFISFSYGGKLVEDFGVISVIEGDRLTRNLYANFEDLTSTYSVVDGQFYWGTHFTTNQISFSLATDGMTQNQLDEFRHWFMPGQAKELILAEHPNRAIMARIDTPPTYSLLPFRHETQIQIGPSSEEGTVYTAITTLYKGSIQLSFVMDEPYWHSIVSFLEETYKDANNQNVATLDNADALKILLEDNIPYLPTVTASCFLGGDQMVTNPLPQVGDADTIPEGAQIGVSRLGLQTYSSINITTDTPAYLYYCGTAPAYPILRFTLTPQFNSEGYIIAPYNSIAPITDAPSYNTLMLKKSGAEIAQFRFSTPSLYTGYNQALHIVDEAAAEGGAVAWPDIAKKLRLGIKEYHAREWAEKIIQDMKEEWDNNSSWATEFKSKMRDFLGVTSSINEQTDTITYSTTYSATFIFDSATGQATGSFECAAIGGATTIYEENVGDMVCSDYLVIRDRNVLGEDHQLTNNQCISITSDYPGTLSNFIILYDYMYL